MGDSYDKGTENRVEGKADEVAGKFRNAVGGATSDTSEQLRGKAQELKGKMKQGVGEAQQDADRDRDV